MGDLYSTMDEALERGIRNRLRLREEKIWRKTYLRVIAIPRENRSAAMECADHAATEYSKRYGWEAYKAGKLQQNASAMNKLKETADKLQDASLPSSDLVKEYQWPSS